MAKMVSRTRFNVTLYQCIAPFFVACDKNDDIEIKERKHKTPLILAPGKQHNHQLVTSASHSANVSP
jgi:hypothetical protein